MAVTQEQMQTLLRVFDLRGFEEMWYLVNQAYQACGFSDSLSDSDRITEYKWVMQQLRRFVTQHKDGLLDQDQGLEGIAWAAEIVKSRMEYGGTRKEIVYGIMRDRWLEEVAQVAMDLAATPQDDIWIEEE